MELVARKREQETLERVFSSERSELVALYGRRRVGKTFLVRRFFARKPCVYLELVGQKREDGRIASVQHQLSNFQYAWQRAFGDSIEKPANWEEAFLALKQKVDDLRAGTGTVVLFFDELPWLCSANSRFFENLDQAWNGCFEPAGNVKVIVCGSAATWMLRKVIRARAGLSRRVTQRIHLLPLTLVETSEYLKARGFDFSLGTVAETYMVFGGVPYYLDFLRPEKSLYQNIEDECFRRDGNLHDEYTVVFDSLFKNAAEHRRVVEILAKKRSGMTMAEINHAFAPGSPKAGGTLVQILDHLCACGFASKRAPLFKERRGALYAVADEFTLFSLKWMQGHRQHASTGGVYTQSIASSPGYRSWCGFAFEMLCLKHHEQVRAALGLHKIAATPGVFYASDPDTGSRTAQIDLLFDRADRTITLCEIKHTDGEYTITKADRDAIRSRKAALRAYLSKRRVADRNIVVAFITPYGLKRNRHFDELHPSVVCLQDIVGPLFIDAKKG